MFLDIGFGIILAIISAKIFNLEISSFLISSSIFFTLLPDIDFFIELAKRGKVGGRVLGEHRAITHFPLTFIPFIFLIWLVFGNLFCFISFTGTFFHFLHDSVFLGWGIKWFWPFKNRTYKFFVNPKTGWWGKEKIIHSWDDKELEKICSEYGDPDWIKNFYLKPHPIGIIELLSFILSLFVLFLTL